MIKITALIPAYNEEATIGATVRAVMLIPTVTEVVVIDDGSLDNTAFFAYSEGARILQMQDNSGKGTAMNRGVAEAKADIYLLLDADLEESATEAKCLLEPIVSGHADMSIAIIHSPKGHKAGFGLVRGLAKWGIEKLTGSKVIAPLSGQRAVRSEVLLSIGGFEEGFGVETALTVDALRAGFRVVEMEVPITHRLTGRNLKGFLHRGRQFRDVALSLWRRRKRV